MDRPVNGSTTQEIGREMEFPARADAFPDGRSQILFDNPSQVSSRWTRDQIDAHKLIRLLCRDEMTMKEVLERSHEIALAASARLVGQVRVRMEITAREIGQILFEMRNPHHDYARPIWRRVVRVLTRLTEDGIL